MTDISTTHFDCRRLSMGLDRMSTQRRLPSSDMTDLHFSLKKSVVNNRFDNEGDICLEVGETTEEYN